MGPRSSYLFAARNHSSIASVDGCNRKKNATRETPFGASNRAFRAAWEKNLFSGFDAPLTWRSPLPPPYFCCGFSNGGTKSVAGLRDRSATLSSLGRSRASPPALSSTAETSYLFDPRSSRRKGEAINAFVVAALTEETVKLLVVLVYLRRKPHFDEVMDGILYAAAASLGFCTP